jgi:phosphoenolpyruvate phosphomutase / 2-hydroxyethylphosphonate cytidylyltransferase
MKKVYVCLIADLLHAGHIRVLNEAKKHGKVIVGLLSDAAISELNETAYLSFNQRKEVLEALSIVSEVVPQVSASYRENLVKISPDYIVHGDDWCEGPLLKYRKEVVEIIAQQGGKLIEVPYSKEISDGNIKNQLLKYGITTVHRLGRLRNLIRNNRTLRILESHSPLSALFAENSSVIVGDQVLCFDGMWSSSLTDSTVRGKPDIEAVDLTSRLNTVNDIFEVTTKPMIFDADTGGKIEHFEFTVKSLERTGVSAVVIEDKIGLKKNSLFGNDVFQEQDTIEGFCHKIEAGKRAQLGTDFMIIARVESLILEAGMADALLRAFAYVEAGADGIMIHSRHKDPGEIMEFIGKFRLQDSITPLVVVPTSFNAVTVEEFASAGVNVVIYANHMLRAAYPAMSRVAESILLNGRSLEAEPQCMSVKNILECIPGTK